MTQPRDPNTAPDASGPSRPAWEDATTVSPTPAPPTTQAGGPAPTWAPSFYAEPPPAPAAAAPPAYEPPPEAVETERVKGRSGAARWAVALGATALILVVGLGLLLFARQGTTSTAAAPGYLAPDTVAYGEFRLDLPGDQRQNLGEFLSHFPGFADSSTLEAKLDDVFDRIFAQSGTEYRYTTDVKPWFGGQVSFGLPAPEDGQEAPAPPIAIVTVKDRAAAQSVLDRLRTDAAEAGESWVSEEHAGTTIWSVQLDDPEPGVDGFHYTLTDDALLLGGNLAELEAALDRKAGGGDNLGRSDNFNGALSGLREDRLATIWLDTSLIKQRALESLDESGTTAGAQTLRSFLDDMPNRVVAEVWFESDRLVAEARTDTPGDVPDAKVSELADNAPADTLVYLEWRDVGQGLADFVRQIKTDPTIQEAAPELMQVEAFLGGSLEGFFDWMGDVAIVGGRDGDAPTAALLATARNEDAGRQRLSQLAALLQFAGQFGFSVNSEEIDDTTITTITIPGDLGSSLGAPVPVPDDVVPEDIEINYGFRNGLFVIAATADEAVRLLNLPGEESLAGTERFRAALETAGGAENVGISWIDVAGLRGIAEELLPAEEREMYEREIRPYLEPLDLVVGIGLREGDELVQRSIITVK